MPYGFIWYILHQLWFSRDPSTCSIHDENFFDSPLGNPQNWKVFAGEIVQLGCERFWDKMWNKILGQVWAIGIIR